KVSSHLSKRSLHIIQKSN
uniref:Uncharacterized protein n=1 Tax=Panagrolaimus sp. JU765 TaxID=591449 RepID=A0AC34QG46_9BILA